MLNQTGRSGQLRRTHWLAACLCAAMSIGCFGGGGQRHEEMARAAGTVTLGGKPLTAGMVSLSSSETGFSAAGEIKPDGTFEIPQIPVGEYRASISPPAPKEAGDPAAVKASGPEIPAKYRDAATSGLKAIVPIEGATDLKFELQ